MALCVCSFASVHLFRVSVNIHPGFLPWSLYYFLLLALSFVDGLGLTSVLCLRLAELPESVLLALVGPASPRVFTNLRGVSLGDLLPLFFYLGLRPSLRLQP